MRHTGRLELTLKCKVKHRTEITNFDEWVAAEEHYYYELEYNSKTSTFTTPIEFVVCVIYTVHVGFNT